MASQTWSSSFWGPDLEELFSNGNWKHAKLYGGNAWLGITQLVLALVDALQNQDMSRIEDVAVQLKNARHNSGSVQDKIARLEKARNQKGF